MSTENVYRGSHGKQDNIYKEGNGQQDKREVGSGKIEIEHSESDNANSHAVYATPSEHDNAEYRNKSKETSQANTVFIGNNASGNRLPEIENPQIGYGESSHQSNNPPVYSGATYDNSL